MGQPDRADQPDLADIFDVPTKFRAAENYASLKSYPFLLKSVLNIITRGYTGADEVNRKRHDAAVKDTVCKIALTHGSAVGVEVSKMVGGPSRSTLMQEMKPDVPLLGHLEDGNLMDHCVKAKGWYYN